MDNSILTHTLGRVESKSHAQEEWKAVTYWLVTLRLELTYNTFTHISFAMANHTVAF